MPPPPSNLHHHHLVGSLQCSMFLPLSRSTKAGSRNTKRRAYLQLSQAYQQLSQASNCTGRSIQGTTLFTTLVYKFTRKGDVFLIGSKKIPGLRSDMAFHHVRCLSQISSYKYVWNKVNVKHLFIDDNKSNEGWDACVYHYCDSTPLGEDEGKHFFLSKKPKRIIQGISIFTRRICPYFTRKSLCEYSRF
jgi:hypothetical protein